MSDKFFFKGKAMNKPKHVSHSFTTDRQVRAGTQESPLILNVPDSKRADEIQRLLAEHKLIAKISIDNSVAENISALESLINTPKTFVAEKKPQRNDPCICGSGKKFKKCCAV